MPSISPRATQAATMVSATSANWARICITAFGLRMRDSTVRVWVCSGASASRIRLWGRNGVSVLKLLSPTPAPEMKSTGLFSTACTCSWRAQATRLG